MGCSRSAARTANYHGPMGGNPDLDKAIEDALESAQLRAGDSLGSTTAQVVVDVEPFAVDVGDVDGD